MQTITIDQEFQALIPKLALDERQQLEANIQLDGCRDPLVIWQGILVDGHNRYEICTRLGLDFQIVEKQFDDRDHAIEWIIKNQFGRRNLNDYQRGSLALKLKPIFEARAKANHLANAGDKKSKSACLKSDEPIIKIRTDNEMAKVAGIGKDNIRKIEKVEAQCTPELIQALQSSEISINTAAEFIDLPVEKQQIAIADIAENPAKDVIKQAVKNHRAIGTGENEWYTPSEYAAMAREVLGTIDLDPASCQEANEVIKAEKFYTKEDDGLTKTWSGNLWINPPYSRDLMPLFCEKLKKSYFDGDVKNAILVSHNNTDTCWFHTLTSVAKALCFPKKRIRFYRGSDIASPTNGQTFFYFGTDPKKFAEVFREIGIVVSPVHR
jgi:hypothetical protein